MGKRTFRSQKSKHFVLRIILAPKITGWMDFSGSKMNMEFIEGDWKSGNPSDQLSERIVNNPSAFPSTAKRFTVIAGNREIKKEYIFLIVERPLQ